MARPRVHLCLSALALAPLRHRLTLAQQLAFLAGGVLVDADHLVDYGLRRRWPASGWLVLPLHGWEYVAAALIIGARRRQCRLLVAAGLGLAFHLLVDQLTNRPAQPLLYSVLFRAGHQFRGGALAFRHGDGQWVQQSWWRWF